MAASLTVPQVSSVIPRAVSVPPSAAIRRGVLTLSGYGIRAHVERGHLLLEDGVGADRRSVRLPRVGHGLKRLIVVGMDGVVSLAALRWLRDQKAALVFLERDGEVLLTTGSTRSPGGRLRRAQALAGQTDVGMGIVRMLLAKKFEGQAHVLTTRLHNPAAADAVLAAQQALSDAKTPDAARWIEGQAAMAYWSAWRDVPVNFPTGALRRVPQHWRVFGVRRSPLTGSPRVAINPANAMLNYGYSILEAESKLAALAVGLDPSLGVLHADTDARYSMACDLMESVRPQVDAYVLDWLTTRRVSRDWFFERGDGSCRLMTSLTTQLAETAATWAGAVAPVAERVAQMLWDSVPTWKAQSQRPTPLTERHRRDVRNPAEAPLKAIPRPPRLCSGCGARLGRASERCDTCARKHASTTFGAVMAKGRKTANSPDAQRRRAETQRRHEAAKRAWNPADQPARLTPTFYRDEIQPALRQHTLEEVAKALGASLSYAAMTRVGRCTPHPRHWQALAQLVGRESPLASR